MKLFTLLTLAGWVLAQTTVEAPAIGTMLDASGMLRTVYGVPGGFVLGEAVDAADEAASLDRSTERRGDTVVVLSADGAVVDSLPSAAGPVLLLEHGALFTNDEELILQRRDASRVRFPLNGVTALRAMSVDWVQAMTASGSFAVRVESGREAIFALPGTLRTEARRR